MGSGGSSHFKAKKASATSSKTATEVEVGVTGSDIDGDEHFLRTSYKQTWDTNTEQTRSIKSSRSIRNGGRSGHRDYKMENSDTTEDTSSESGNHTRKQKKSKSTTDFESHWSDDGDVLAIVVPQQWQNNEKDRRGSDSSLDENIREIERTISVDSGLASTAMTVTPVMTLAKAIVSSNEPETESVAKDSATLSNDSESSKFFCKRPQDSSALTKTTIRPQTSYANTSNNYRLLKGSVSMPRRRSIAPLLKLEKTKDSSSLDRDLQSAQEKEEDDWEYKQPEIEGFDPVKFKEVNSFQR